MTIVPHPDQKRGDGNEQREENRGLFAEQGKAERRWDYQPPPAVVLAQGAEQGKGGDADEQSQQDVGAA